MGRAYRLAGAIVAESAGDCFLVGNTKKPCDFPAHGFEKPVEIDALKHPFVRLARLARSPELGLSGAFLELDLEGEALAQTLAARFVIERTGSISERLWRLVAGCGDADAELPEAGAIDARWLGAMPQAVWQVIRDTVLRCS